jgi:hypothetical protein
MKKLLFFCVIVFYLSQCTETIIKYIEPEETLLLDTVTVEFTFAVPYPATSSRSITLADTVTVPILSQCEFITFAIVQRYNNYFVFDLLLSATMTSNSLFEYGFLRCNLTDNVAPITGYVHNTFISLNNDDNQSMFICFGDQLYGKIESQMSYQNIKSPFYKSDSTSIVGTQTIGGSYQIFVKTQTDGSRLMY